MNIKLTLVELNSPFRARDFHETSLAFWKGFLTSKTMKKIIKTAIIGLILLPLVSFASIDTNLQYGSKGPEVTELQEFLIAQNYLNTASTGNFYSLTLKAVKSYQMANNIPNTGYVGILTRTSINSELLNNLASSTAQAITETGSPVASTSTDSALQAALQQSAIMTAQLNAQLEAQAKLDALNQSIAALTNQIKSVTTPAPAVTQPVSTGTSAVVYPASIVTITETNGNTVIAKDGSSYFNYNLNIQNQGGPLNISTIQSRIVSDTLSLGNFIVTINGQGNDNSFYAPWGSVIPGYIASTTITDSHLGDHPYVAVPANSSYIVGLTIHMGTNKGLPVINSGSFSFYVGSIGLENNNNIGSVIGLPTTPITITVQ